MQKSAVLPIFSARPAKGFTPIIGLAVVVALAMVAVFGAMSLTNPAFAAVGAPADAELAERTFSPQTTELDDITVYVGGPVTVNIADQIRGGLSNYSAVASDPAAASDPSNILAADGLSLVIGLNNSLNLRIVGGTVSSNQADLDSDGCQSGTIRFWIDLVDETQQRMEIDVKLCPATTPSSVTDIPEQRVQVGTGAANNDPPDYTAVAIKLDLSGYFTDGKGTEGTSVVTGFALSEERLSGTADDVSDLVEGRLGHAAGTFIDDIDTLVVPANGLIQLRAGEGAVAGDAIEVTVSPRTANVNAGVAAAAQTFIVDVVAEDAGPGPSGPMDPDLPKLTPGSTEPGDGTRYDIEFQTIKDATL